MLRELGVNNIEELVDSQYPPTRTPRSDREVSQWLLRAAGTRSPPRPGPIAPVFERYTAEARRAYRAALESEALLEHPELEPFHLLLGCLQVPASIAARALSETLEPSDIGVAGEAMERAWMYGRSPAHQTTGIPIDETRRLLAEEALKHAYRHGHPQITTGDLLLAVLDSSDPVLVRIVASGAVGSGPRVDRLARRTLELLPGDEAASGEDEQSWIDFPMLIRIMTTRVAEILPRGSEILPRGWRVWGSGRSGGLSLKVPGSTSEEDFRIDLSWIVAEEASGRDRLVRGCQKVLEDLQRVVSEHTCELWPGEGAAPNASVLEDKYNPALRLWYRAPEAPALEIFEPPLLLGQVLCEP